MRTQFFLIVLAAFGSAHASTEIENAISPDKKWVLTMEAEEFRCKVFLKNKTNGKVLTSFNVEDFFAADVRDTITARWRNDSAAVALGIHLGRSLSDCEVIVLGNGQWNHLALAEDQLAKVRERNNEKGGKSQEYLNFESWLPGGVKMSYQGNLGSVEDLECGIVLGAKPYLRIVKAMLEGEVEQEPKDDTRAKASVTAADKDLNAAYRALRSKLDAAGREALKEEQLQWLKERDQITDDLQRQRFIEARTQTLMGRAELLPKR